MLWMVTCYDHMCEEPMICCLAIMRLVRYTCQLLLMCLHNRVFNAVVACQSCKCMASR